MFKVIIALLIGFAVAHSIDINTDSSRYNFINAQGQIVHTDLERQVCNFFQSANTASACEVIKG